MQEPEKNTLQPVRTSRRNFLKLSAAALGAAAVFCGGAGYLATRQPALEVPGPTTCGGKNSMNGKTLIAYATRCGSTAEIAQAIGNVLCESGAAADVLPVKNVASLDGYTSVILGSAIRFGQWLPEALKFVEGNQAALGRMPAAVFTVHILNTADDDASRQARQAYTAPLHKLLNPQAEAFFAGVGDSSKVSFLERIVARAVKSPEGDFRDWQAIQAWASGLKFTQA